MGRKRFVLVTIILSIVFALVVAGYIAFNSFMAFMMGDPNIIQEVVSPDNKYVAYVFEANAGATTRFTYRLSILKNGKKPKAGDVGNTFITYNEFDVEWVDGNTLKVNNIPSTNVFKQETEVYGIKVNYNYKKELTF